MGTKQFWIDLGERAVATFAQTLLAVIGVSTFDPTDTVTWGTALITAALAALLSVLKSLAATRFGDPDSASLVDGRGEGDGW